MSKSNFSKFGIWTCAALYAAIGLIGVVFFSTQFGIASSTDSFGSTDGYGIKVAATSSHR